MDIRIEGEETPKEVKNTPDSTLVPHGEIDRMQLAQTFDLKPSETGKYKKELDGLIEYAKLKTDDHSPEGLKWAIRSLGTKLGTPPLGEKLLPYLYRYAYLYMEGKKIDGQKDKFLRGEQDD